MIAFSKYYYFSSEDVEYIECANNSAGDYPYRLTIHFKSGTSCSVNYADPKSRETARNNMVREIEYERRADVEKTHNMLTILKNTVERIDRRQLRIWKQLRDLLGLKIEEGNQ